MAAYLVQSENMAAVADAIREKTGGTGELVFPDEWIEGIGAVYEAGCAAGGSSGEEEVPNDGKTRIYIHLEDGRTSPMLGCCPNGTVTVDWGDGTEPDTLTGTSNTTLKYAGHEYAEAGDYVITLTVSGGMTFLGVNSSAFLTGAAILRYSSANDYRNCVYQNAVRRVLIGNGVTIGNYAFNYCNALSSITIPEGVTGIGSYAFNYCSALSSITFPEGVTTFATYAFNCCYALSSVTFPASVTRINAYAFSYCTGVKYYDFSAATSVPALANATAFSGISADCEIRVPAALYDEWIAATNWSGYADYIVAV